MTNPGMFSVDNPPFDADRLFSLMKAARVDLALVSSRHNTRYLTGGYFYPLYMWDSNTRRTQHLSFLVLTPGSLGDAFFVGRPLEKETMLEANVWVQPCYEAKAIGSRHTVAELGEQLRKRGLDSGRIAVEMAVLPTEGFVALQHELPHAEFVEANEIFDPLRAIKCEREIEIIRDGSRRNLEGVTTALAAGTAGETTAQVADRVKAEFERRGLHYLYALVCAAPHFFRAPSVKRRWEAGGALHIDSGALMDGYVVETCRMGHLGSPSPLADELLSACRDLRDHVLSLFRPGTPVGEVQRNANEYLARTEFGDIGKFIAHGIGMVHHEDPVVNLDADGTLEAGMLLSIEMEYRHTDVGHVKVEELVVIMPEGHDVITPDGEKWTIAG